MNQPPFKKGDVCVADNPNWCFVPLIVNYELINRQGRWFYGESDILVNGWRLATKSDLQIMIDRVLKQANRNLDLAMEWTEIRNNLIINSIA